MDITPSQFRRILLAVGHAFGEQKGRLSELDGQIGDGDHGVTMAMGWKAVAASLNDLTLDETCTSICNVAAKAFLNSVGGSAGPLYATALMRGGGAVKSLDSLDEAAIEAFFAAALEGIRQRGKAEPGDKTMLDAWLPAVAALREARSRGADLVGMLSAARDGAQSGAQATADMIARKGRASRLGERSRGHVDPGAASTAVFFDAFLQGAKRTESDAAKE